MKEVQEYVENGVTPEGLIQPVHDPDSRSSSEGEREEERDKGKNNDIKTAVPENDQLPRKKETKSKVSSVSGTRHEKGGKVVYSILCGNTSLSLSLTHTHSLSLTHSLTYSHTHTHTHNITHCRRSKSPSQMRLKNNHRVAATVLMYLRALALAITAADFEEERAHQESCLARASTTWRKRIHQRRQSWTLWRKEGGLLWGP